MEREALLVVVKMKGYQEDELVTDGVFNVSEKHDMIIACTTDRDWGSRVVCM